MTNAEPQKRDIRHIVSGLAIYALLVALIAIGIGLRLPPIPSQFSNWLSASHDPQRALISFSVLIGSFLLILLRVGVEAPFIKINLQDNARRYVAGLPLWFVFFCVAASGVGAWLYSPRCRPPEAVYFEVVGSSTRLQPMQVLEVQPGQSLSIQAKAADPNDLLSCTSWEFTGPAFHAPGERSGCQINLQFSGQPGASFITLVGTQNFCNQKSIFSLEVRVKAP
ncbi:MAG: hypothetical protein AB1750_08340 [Chloroflexota bacterium]